jgi:glycerol-3-phosphate acyltransferase PlsY
VDRNRNHVLRGRMDLRRKLLSPARSEPPQKIKILSEEASAQPFMILFLLVLFAYLLGSLPTGYIMGYLAGVDVRTAGSGNVGATNVARVVGKRQGAWTLLADSAKGFVPAIVAARSGLEPSATALVGIAAFLGHLYPVFLKFQGGKGVATGFGVLLGVAPWVAACLIPLFGMMLLTTRIVSLSSMVGAAAAPVVLWLFNHPPAVILMGAFLAVMVILRHQRNIQRLRSGTEPKFGASSFR